MHSLRPMGRRLLVILPVFFLLACGNPAGFRAKVMEFERVDLKNATQPTSTAKPGDVVRQSGQIQFDQLTAVWDGEDVTLKGSLKLAGKPYGDVALKGTRKGEQIAFSTDQSDLAKRLKGQAICTSDDGICSEYFIDMFARDTRGVIQHDQFVLKKPAPSEPEAIKPSAPTTTTLPLKENEPVIQDEIENPKSGSFVGTSDEEARALFENESTLESGKGPSTTTTTVIPSTTSTTAVPVAVPAAGPPVKPAPEKSSSPSGAKEQAIGKTDKGLLQNATDLSKIASAEGSFFRFIWPANKTNFGTLDMAAIIQKMAKFAHEKISGYILTIGDISTQHGGKLFSHLSHQNGLDADISYLVNNKRSEFSSVVTKQGVNSDFMLTENWELFKYAFSVGRVELIFVDGKVKRALCEQAILAKDLKDNQDRGAAYEILRRVMLVSGHDNHFHLRISCPKSDKKCQQPVYTLRDSGCF